MTKRARIVTIFLILLSAVLIFYVANKDRSDQQKSTNVEAGRISGVIDFVNTTSDVSSYLQGNPVVDGGPGRISAYDASVVSLTPIVSTSYAFENQLLGATTYRAASHSFLVTVPPVDYVITASPIRFQDNAAYYFGTRDATSPYAHQCMDVQPALNTADSTVCNMEECASLVSARITLIGETTGFAAFLGSVSCRIEARVGGSVQATTPASLAMSDLLGSGAATSLLVRSGTEVTLMGSCDSPLVDDNRSFSFSLPPMSTPSCGVTLPEIPIEIPVPPIVIVEPATGSIKGLFDISQLTEVNAQIGIDINSLTAVPLLLDAGTSPDRSNTLHYWVIEDVPEGSQVVYARAITDQGNRIVTFPYLTGSVNGPVIVSEGQTTDVDSRFISLLQPVVGKFIAWNPSGVSRLSDLVTEPFASNFRISDSNFIEARGGSLSLLGGASGFRARSYGRLDGTYNSSTGNAELSYQLDLVGISSIGAPTDGSGTLATPWDIKDIQLLGESPDNRFKIDVKIPNDISFESDPASMNEISVITQPDIQACFGEIALNLRVSPSLGTIFEPRMDFINQAPSAIEPTPFGNYFSITDQTNAVGAPVTASAASQQASVSIPLPEGTQYSVDPSIKLINADGGGEQTLDLPDVDMPATGTLGCGSSLSSCLEITDTSGGALPLSVSIEPSQLICGAANDSLNLTINVDTGGADVDYVFYTIDSITGPVILCENCGTNPGPFVNAIDFQSLNLLAGPHTLHVEAGRNGGCSASYDYLFYIEESPIQLQCPASVSAQLNLGELSIAADDPRVGNLVPEIVGGCGLPSPLVDNIPSEFTVGTTTVQFSLLDDPSVSCSTDVAIAGNESYLAVDSIDGLSTLSINDLSDVFQAQASQINDFNFSDDGEKIVISSSTGLRQLNAQDGSLDLVISDDAVVAAQYKPGSQTELAYVTRVTDGNNDMGYQLNVRNADGSTLSQLPAAIIHPTLKPSDLQLAWSVDGTKIGVAYNVNTPDSAGHDISRLIYLREYEVSNASVVEIGSPLLLVNPAPADDDAHNAQLLDFVYAGTSRFIATSKNIFKISNSSSIVTRVDDNLDQTNVYRKINLSNLQSGIILVVTNESINAILVDSQVVTFAPTSVVSGKILTLALQVEELVLAVITNSEVVLLQINLSPVGTTEISRRSIVNLNGTAAFR